MCNRKESNKNKYVKRIMQKGQIHIYEMCACACGVGHSTFGWEWESNCVIEEERKETKWVDGLATSLGAVIWDKIQHDRWNCKMRKNQNQTNQP